MWHAILLSSLQEVSDLPVTWPDTFTFLCTIRLAFDLPLDFCLPVVTSACVLDFVSCFLVWYLTIWLNTDLFLCPDAASALCSCKLTQPYIPKLSLPSDSILCRLTVDNLWLLSWLCSCPLIKCYCVPTSSPYPVVHSHQYFTFNSWCCLHQLSLWLGGLDKRGKRSPFFSLISTMYLTHWI